MEIYVILDLMYKLINNDWDDYLQEIYQSSYFKNLLCQVDKEYNNDIVFPIRQNVFKALRLTSYHDTKVLILGQDPYHGVGEANGLCFSVNKGIKIPPSLKNIYKELKDDLGIIKDDGDLTNWASEGVLLLNAVLTVKKDMPASHKFLNWELFTDKIIEILNNKQEKMVFILMGEFAKKKNVLITNPIHKVIMTSHPSPFSVHKGFFGSKIFSKTNQFLISNNISPINW